MSLLEVSRISKSYDATVYAVRDVDLSLERGEILCLLGPSGSGKTTLLRLIAGLEQPDHGVINFEGRDVTAMPPHERGFGMMFQDFALFPHRNVGENIGFGLRMQGLNAADIARRVAEMLALVELDGLAERSITQLSGGEQQRVALARALAPKPQLLLLDEPLGALDRALRERLMLDLRTILKRVDMTALYVTHDQTEAFAVGDRVAVMNAGEIVQIGTPQVIYEHPATPFVAHFLGFRNLIPGMIGDGGVVETPVGRFLPDGLLPPVGDKITLLIKPVMTNAQATADPSPAEVNTIKGIVDMVTFRGRFSQIWVSVNDTRLLFEKSGDPQFHSGDGICISLSSDQLRIYESPLQ